MNFFKGRHRIIDMLRPTPRVVGMRSYLMARWRRLRGLGQYYWVSSRRNPWKPRPRQTGGWLPGRYRIAGMKAERRVIDPAVRYMPVTRQYNEIVRRRRKQRAFPPPFLWAKRIPSRLASLHGRQ